MKSPRSAQPPCLINIYKALGIGNFNIPRLFYGSRNLHLSLTLDLTPLAVPLNWPIQHITFSSTSQHFTISKLFSLCFFLSEDFSNLVQLFSNVFQIALFAQIPLHIRKILVCKGCTVVIIWPRASHHQGLEEENTEDGWVQLSLVRWQFTLIKPFYTCWTFWLMGCKSQFLFYFQICYPDSFPFWKRREHKWPACGVHCRNSTNSTLEQ